MVTTSVTYPESDGLPIADNTKQFHWIVYFKERLDWLFAAEPLIFVAGDLLWYPVEGNNKVRQAPDAMVVFGRPKGNRGSYRQWLEDNIPPQVVFEVLSPGNTPMEMTRKFQFYEHHGVEEYYLYDPDNADLAGFVRGPQGLESVSEIQGWISPRLQVRFGMTDAGDLELLRPDGMLFESYQQIAERAERERSVRQQAQQQLVQVQQELHQEQAAREQAEERLRQLAEYLRQRGIDPENL